MTEMLVDNHKKLLCRNPKICLEICYMLATTQRLSYVPVKNECQLKYWDSKKKKLLVGLVLAALNDVVELNPVFAWSHLPLS